MRNSSLDRETTAWKFGRPSATTTATEKDPLLLSSQRSSSAAPSSSSALRSRRNRSPTVPVQQRYGTSSSDMDTSNTPYVASTGESNSTGNNNHTSEHQQQQQTFNLLPDDTGTLSLGDRSRESSHSGGSRSLHQLRRSYIAPKEGNGDLPLLEIPEDVYEVRKSALQVLKPLTRTWLIVTVGFALSVLFGMARWLELVQGLSFWFIMLPSWLAHVALFWCHIQSAKALSTFIASANDRRQRPDSRDHLDRTEYLPLLQRSLKFGLKTGLISFGFFIFEILIYFRLSKISKGKKAISLWFVFMPIWLMVLGGVVDGIICKTQHFLRVFCWLLGFIAMLLSVLKVDFGFPIDWTLVVSPVILLLTISTGTLFYIVYGHQIGYYRLSEAQLTAGNLYALAASFCIVLTVLIAEILPYYKTVEIETRMFLIVVAPLVVTFVGMGAWVVSRDEYGKLLLYGGQAAVHPKQLVWQKNGWSSVQGKGVTIIPMFGEVSFCPLDSKTENTSIELCSCCTCYPREESLDEDVEYVDDLHGHPYLSPAPTNDLPPNAPWQTSATNAV